MSGSEKAAVLSHWLLRKKESCNSLSDVQGYDFPTHPQFGRQSTSFLLCFRHWCPFRWLPNAPLIFSFHDDTLHLQTSHDTLSLVWRRSYAWAWAFGSGFCIVRVFFSWDIPKNVWIFCMIYMKRYLLSLMFWLKDLLVFVNEDNKTKTVLVVPSAFLHRSLWVTLRNQSWSWAELLFLRRDAHGSLGKIHVMFA